MGVANPTFMSDMAEAASHRVVTEQWERRRSTVSETEGVAANFTCTGEGKAVRHDKRRSFTHRVSLTHAACNRMWTLCEENPCQARSQNPCAKHEPQRFRGAKTRVAIPRCLCAGLPPRPSRQCSRTLPTHLQVHPHAPEQAAMHVAPTTQSFLRLRR